MARWNHTDPFPNSEVKRCCGDDSLGVALRENSSMPGLLFNNKAFSIYLEGVLFFARHDIVDTTITIVFYGTSFSFIRTNSSITPGTY
jgi:hypothetical protein